MSIEYDRTENYAMRNIKCLPCNMSDSLKVIYCSCNNIEEITKLPIDLVELYCSFNKLIKLPNTMPYNLTILQCFYNCLTSLPNILPNNLRILGCYNNKLTHISYLPDSLVELDCSNNKIVSLPDKLPSSLTILCCRNNKLRSLPELPIGLTTLECDYNDLTMLPILPNLLNRLTCNNNKYLHIEPYVSQRFGLYPTPNYDYIVSRLQILYKAKLRLKRLKFLKQLEQHIDEFMYRPGNYGYMITSDSWNKHYCIPIIK